MKKILLIALMLVLAVSICGCSQNATTPSEKIIAVSEEMDYKVKEANERNEYATHIYSVAVTKDCNVEYIEFDDIDMAIAQYQLFMTEYAKLIGEKISEKDVESDIYTKTANGSFVYVSIKDNSIINVFTNEYNKDDAMKFIERIGY